MLALTWLRPVETGSNTVGMQDSCKILQRSLHGGYLKKSENTSFVTYLRTLERGEEWEQFDTNIGTHY